MAAAYMAILKSGVVTPDSVTWFNNYQPRKINTANIGVGTIGTDDLEIPGDSTTTPYRSWTSLNSYQFDFSARAAQNSYRVVINKTIDRTSPRLGKLSATRDKLDAAVIEVVHPNRRVPTTADLLVDSTPQAHKTSYFISKIQVESCIFYGGCDEQTQSSYEELSLSFVSFAIRYDTGNDGHITYSW